ncbi:hypothetical protein PoB_000574500 [Plakobranchus ocellatus]|uniref:Uncharacterized protein n=1 Tax=Plakobranchus ocellatus TaxID=259542 RepID=A0AAV3Y9Q9_9GAST|nr:hypothetical protein PoB_000574500 [Plakobranchus ocellatus]
MQLLHGLLRPGWSQRLPHGEGRNTIMSGQANPAVAEIAVAAQEFVATFHACPTITRADNKTAPASLAFLGSCLQLGNAVAYLWLLFD